MEILKWFLEFTFISVWHFIGVIMLISVSTNFFPNQIGGSRVIYKKKERNE
jgi:hypothetical protein